ncbi:alpha/beta hydrolase [Nocardia sp. CC227C]|uniref:alpha/beta hydrolase n=1 Tax=Nocardia sp. CC227C TaxID=3044562 RepID=UPI00278C3BBC|nr:alpha/beta hydrolase [Nocardia sp. CC227C]
MTYAFDADLLPWIPRLPAVDYTDLPKARLLLAEAAANAVSYEPVNPVEIADRIVPGRPDIPVRIYRPTGLIEATPALLYLHGGGFMLGDLDLVHPAALRFADRAGVQVITVGYRLAPEHPFPAALQDSYAVLAWTARHAKKLDIVPDRIGIGGESAGGGLAAATALLARSRGGPGLCFQCLAFPELDDRLDTVSARTFVDTPKWNRPSAEVSWQNYLGSTAEPGSKEVSPFAAPARAADLSGLPPAFISVCEFDPLRDENLTYAHRLIKAGVHTELCYYPGTFHACHTISAAVSRRMVADQLAAVRRGLNCRSPRLPQEKNRKAKHA